MKIKKIVCMRFLLCLGLLYAGLTVTSVPVYNLSSTNKLSSLAGGGPEMFLGLFSSKITPYTVNSSYKAKPIVPSVCVGSTFNFVNVGLTDLAHGSYLGFVFDNANMKIPSTVLSKGLNVLINMVPSGSQQQITVQLVDTSGNLYAQGTQTINQGLYLAEFGFNVNNSNAANPAGNPPSTALSDFPIASGTPVFFSTGPKMTPVLKPPYLNLTGKTELSTQGGSFNGTQPFVPVTGNIKATPVTATPITVSGGLQFINVSLTDSANQAFLSYTFDSVIMNLLTKSYPYLLANGIYITISGIALSAKAKNKYAYVVTLQDSAGNIYASGFQEISQGLATAEIAFNTMNSAQATGTTSTAVLNVPINGSPIVYQQQASSVLTTPVVTLPPAPVNPPAVSTLNYAALLNLSYSALSTKLQTVNIQLNHAKVEKYTIGDSVNGNRPLSMNINFSNLAFVFFNAPSWWPQMPSTQVINIPLSNNFTWNNGILFTVLAIDANLNVIADLTKTMPTSFALFVHNSQENFISNMVLPESSAVILNPSTTPWTNVVDLGVVNGVVPNPSGLVGTYPVTFALQYTPS